MKKIFIILIFLLCAQITLGFDLRIGANGYGTLPIGALSNGLNLVSDSMVSYTLNLKICLLVLKLKADIHIHLEK